MAESRSDYVRTDELNNALIPIAVIMDALGVSRDTLERRLKGIERHTFKGGKAVRWGDIASLFPSTP